MKWLGQINNQVDSKMSLMPISTWEKLSSSSVLIKSLKVSKFFSYFHYFFIYFILENKKYRDPDWFYMIILHWMGAYMLYVALRPPAYKFFSNINKISCYLN